MNIFNYCIAYRRSQPTLAELTPNTNSTDNVADYRKALNLAVELVKAKFDHLQNLYRVEGKKVCPARKEIYELASSGLQATGHFEATTNPQWLTAIVETIDKIDAKTASTTSLPLWVLETLKNPEAVIAALVVVASVLPLFLTSGFLFTAFAGMAAVGTVLIEMDSHVIDKNPQLVKLRKGLIEDRQEIQRWLLLDKDQPFIIQPVIVHTSGRRTTYANDFETIRQVDRHRYIQYVD